MIWDDGQPTNAARTTPASDAPPTWLLRVKDDSASGRVNIVLNWTEELKRLVPTK